MQCSFMVFVPIDLSSPASDSFLIKLPRSTLTSFFGDNKLVGFTEVTYRNMDIGVFTGAPVIYQ